MSVSFGERVVMWASCITKTDELSVLRFEVPSLKLFPTRLGNGQFEFMF